jgi:hypothetical protein
MGDMTDELDILLSRPLDRLVDDGFSARIVARMRFRQMVLQTLTWSATGAGLLSCGSSYPWFPRQAHWWRRFHGQRRRPLWRWWQARWC